MQRTWINGAWKSSRNQVIYIGTDIESVQRIQKMLEKKPRTLEKFFFKSEWSYAIQKSSPAQTLTGMWCAKEAVIKAISPIDDLSVFDIEICRCLKGIPSAIIHKKNILENGDLMLSISHSKEYATATAIFHFKNRI
ncbi:MAG: holo-ACP synthase [Saprospiraceae bacterium]|nr:holo-ACP synthase [Saprospiraceae bacterium]